MAKARKKLLSEQPFGLRVWSGKTEGMISAHRHGDLELNYVLSGRMTYLIGSSLLTLPIGRLCAIWGAAPHQMLQPDQPIRAMWVTVPLDEVMAWDMPESWIRALLKRGIVPDPHPAGGDLDQLRRWEADLKHDDPAYRRIVQLELQARLRRMALAMESADRSGLTLPNEESSPSSQAVQRMAGHIAAHYRQELHVDQIAAAAELHPNYAMSLFSRHTGLTLNQYLTRMRVAEAQRLLASTRRPILDIAYECGFGSVSRFYEAFAQYVGVSPRRFRSRMTVASEKADQPRVAS